MGVMSAPLTEWCPSCEISWPAGTHKNCPMAPDEEEERLVGLVKHGVGEVLPDDTQKTAAKSDQTEADKQALAQENAEADGGSSDDAG